MIVTSSCLPMTRSKSLIKVDLILQNKVYSSFCAVAAARGGVLGTSYCLILTALGKMTGDKLSKRGSSCLKSSAWASSCCVGLKEGAL